MMDSEQKFNTLKAIVPSVSRETFASLIALEKMATAWNETTNIVSRSTIPDFWKRHILDSAQLIALTEKNIWTDLGSGGGFPGLVIACFLKGRGHVMLIESKKKKCAFLTSVVAELDLPATVIAERIEDVIGEARPPQILTARALAPLSSLLKLGFPILKGHTVGLFHKGRLAEAEIEESRRLWRFDLIKHASRVEPESSILEISNLRKIS